MEVELQKFTKKKLSTILHNVMKEWDSKWTSITELGTLDEFYGEIIGRLWEKTLIYYKSLCPPAEGCSAEEVVAVIIRKGLKKGTNDREEILEKKSKSRIKFENLEADKTCSCA